MTFLQVGKNQVGFEDQHMNFQTQIETESIFISESPIMKIIHEKIKQLAYESSSVLILGARGTGRTTTAYRIFNENPDNSSKHFVKLVCYGLDQSEIENKLFGDNRESGFLSRGTENTLFIKGVEHLGLSLQDKLLSYLLDYKNRKTLPRLIYSAGEKLSEQTKEVNFSQELFEVLSQNLLILPSLSERVEDIPLLVSLFNKQNNFKGHITNNALKTLELHSWQGNIKELQNVCRQILILYKDKDFIDERDISIIVRKTYQVPEKNIKYNPKLSLEDMVNCYIQMSLEHFQSKKKSAKALGISVKTIYNKIKTGCVVYSE